jgi:hypothetical protein
MEICSGETRILTRNKQSWDSNGANYPSFRLKFHRDKRFTTLAAVEQIVNNYQLKEGSVNVSKLVKDIEQDNIGKGEREILETSA